MFKSRNHKTPRNVLIFMVVVTCYIFGTFSVSNGAAPLADPTARPPKNVVKILSIDGGGIRGIIPAEIIKILNDRLIAEQRRRGVPATETKSVGELFDIVAGTSIGGMMALGLTAPGEGGRPRYTPDYMLDVLSTRGPEIFQTPGLLRRLWSLWSYRKSKYGAEGIERVLTELFGDTKMSQLLTTTLVTAYDMELDEPVIFNSERAKLAPAHDFRIRGVARATSAAPTYLPAAAIHDEAGGLHQYIDGGVAMNNPAERAVVEAKKLYPEATRFVVVSLGTGNNWRPLNFATMESAGILPYAPALINIMMGGASKIVDEHLSMMLPRVNGHRQYYRMQTVLEGPDSVKEMDNVTPENVRLLRTMGRRTAAANSEALNGIVRILLQDRAAEMAMWRAMGGGVADTYRAASSALPCLYASPSYRLPLPPRALLAAEPDETPASARALDASSGGEASRGREAVLSVAARSRGHALDLADTPHPHAYPHQALNPTEVSRALAALRAAADEEEDFLEDDAVLPWDGSVEVGRTSREADSGSAGALASAELRTLPIHSAIAEVEGEGEGDDAGDDEEDDEDTGELPVTYAQAPTGRSTVAATADTTGLV